MTPRWARGVLVAIGVLAGAGAAAEQITGARYADPVERYGHFALGRPHEYARLLAATDTGRELTYHLPIDEVFEDLAPRLVKLSKGGPTEILAIVSGRGVGAQLALLGLRGGGLAVIARSPAIGTPMRWLNPVGVADLDGDGQAEIAAVVTPHIGGTLRVYRRDGDRLAEIAALPGFSNHVYGSSELALGAPILVAGRWRLAVPDASRRQLRVIALEERRLVEIGRCALPSTVVGALQPVSPGIVSIGLESGRRNVDPDACRR
jgi:hypothetical protein